MGAPAPCVPGAGPLPRKSDLALPSMHRHRHASRTSADQNSGLPNHLSTDDQPANSLGARVRSISRKTPNHAHPSDIDRSWVQNQHQCNARLVFNRQQHCVKQLAQEREHCARARFTLPTRLSDICQVTTHTVQPEYSESIRPCLHIRNRNNISELSGVRTFLFSAHLVQRCDKESQLFKHAFDFRGDREPSGSGSQAQKRNTKCAAWRRFNWLRWRRHGRRGRRSKKL